MVERRSPEPGQPLRIRAIQHEADRGLGAVSHGHHGGRRRRILHQGAAPFKLSVEFLNLERMVAS